MRAVIDIQIMMRDASASQSIRTQIEQKRAAFQEEIGRRENDLRAAEQQLVQQRTVLSPEAFSERQKQFQQQVAETQRVVQNRKRQLDQAFAAAMQQVEKVIAQIAQELAQQNGYNMILTKNMVVYSVQGMDLTQEALGRLNQRLPQVQVAFPE